MKVFLTGATGFVGGHILTELLKRGHTARCLVRPATLRKLEEGPRLKERPATEYHPGDIADPSSLALGMEGCEAIIHLVGIIREKGEVTFQRVHFLGTQNMVDAARQVGIRRFIHMSALGTSPEAVSAYHRTKYRAEEYLSQSGLEYTIFRPSIIFGPGDGFINLLARIVRLTPFFFPVIGSGNYRLQPVSVYNVAQLFAEALSHPQTLGKVYAVGGPKVYTVNEIVDLILRTMGKHRLKVFIPVGMLSPAVRLMETLSPIVPITSDQLRMLLEDSVCNIEELKSDFSIEWIDLAEGIQEYLR